MNTKFNKSRSINPTTVTIAVDTELTTSLQPQVTTLGTEKRAFFKLLFS